MTGWVAERKPATGTLTPRQLEDYWAALAEASAPEAYGALCTLAHAPAQSVPFLKERVRPVEPVAAGQLDRLIRDLDSDKFALRQKSMTDLEKLGDLAEPALQAALEGKPSLEVRQRLEQLLAKLHGAAPTPGQVRALRAVEMLEAIHNAEAQQVLRALAKGVLGAGLTNEARAAIERLERQHVGMVAQGGPVRDRPGDQNLFP